MQAFALGLIQPRHFTITAASNTSPIVITTSAPNSFVNGDVVTVKNVTGNTNANGTWYAAVLTATTVALYSDKNRQTPVAGNSAYISGGSINAPTQLQPASYDPNPTQMCAKILFSPETGTATGLLYVGTAGLNQSTLAYVLRIINPPPATGLIDYWELDLDGTNVFNLSDYWIDGTNQGTEGVIASYFRH